MKIKRLKLTNFGQHSEINIDTIQGSIVGIIGTNGIGKSTIITALQYALTGNIEGDTVDSWIKNGETTMVVECEFEKDGTVGTIIRKVSSKANGNTRSFKWGNNTPITKAKDVETALEEVLGIDKQSMLNTIFITQGDVDAIVKATDTKRIELFNKLLNLNYTTKRNVSIDEAVKQLSSKVIDLTHYKEQQVVNKDEYDNASTDLIAQTKALQDDYGNKELINNLNKQSKDYLSKAELLHSFETSTLQHVKSEVDMLTLKLNTVYLSDGVTLLEKLENLQSKITSCETAIAEHKENKKYISHIHSCLDNISANLCKLSTLDSLNKNGFDNKSVECINKSIEDYKLYKTKSQTLENNKESIINIENDNINNAKLITILKDSITKYTPKLEEDTASYNELKLRIDNLELLLTIASKLLTLSNDKTLCPLCKQDVSNSEFLASLDVDVLQSDISKLKQELQTLALGIENTKQQDSNDRSKLIKTETLIHTATENITALAKINSSLEVELSEMHDILNPQLYEYYVNNIAQYSMLKNSNMQMCINEQVDSLQKLIKTIPIDYSIDTDMITVIKSMYTNDDVSNKAIDKMTSELFDLTNLKNNITQTSYALELATSSYTGVVETYNKLQDEINKHPFKTLITDLQSNGTYNLKYNLYDIYKVKTESEYALEQLQIIENKTSLLRDLQTRVKDGEAFINDTYENNKNIYNKIEELNEIKHLLSSKDGGITRYYLNYLFHAITGHVSEYLAMLESNFVIEAEDRMDKADLSYKFMKINDDDNTAEEYWMNMNKLSGGEKIRLSIALLLAIQNVICPELCFLILDEPSINLDKNGVDALVHLLEQLDTTMGNQDGQVWIIDHRDELKRALTTTVDLTKPTNNV